AGPATPSQGAAAGPEQRMICSVTPRDFTGNVGGGQYNENEPYRQQDQAMLSASNLAVGCTEFIVEWSYGDVYPCNGANVQPETGGIIWHGMPRDDGTGAPVGPYHGRNDWTNGAPDQNTPRAILVPAAGGGYTVQPLPVQPALVHWPVPANNNGTTWTP